MACRVRNRTELALTYDISTDGCMLQATNGFCDAGDPVELILCGVALRGQVVWVKHRNAGVQFAERTAEKTIAAILAAGEPTAMSSTVECRLQGQVSRLHLAVYGMLAISSFLLLFPH